MPKLGMEPIRRKALVEAAIDEIGEVGCLDVTVSKIARRAGMSSALAHHYFGSKEQMLLATMRHIMSIYGSEVRAALGASPSPRDRVEAIIRASFSAHNFKAGTGSTWLQFYVQAQASTPTKRLLSIYHRRLRSNLLAGLRPLVADPEKTAETIAAMIDGAYLRQVLRPGMLSNTAASQLVLDMAAQLLDRPS